MTSTSFSITGDEDIARMQQLQRDLSGLAGRNVTRAELVRALLAEAATNEEFRRRLIAHVGEETVRKPTVAPPIADDVRQQLQLSRYRWELHDLIDKAERRRRRGVSPRVMQQDREAIAAARAKLAEVEAMA